MTLKWFIKYKHSYLQDIKPSILFIFKFKIITLKLFFVMWQQDPPH
jgi:hypothetical protein